MAEVIKESQEALDTKRRVFNDLLHSNVMEITFKKKDGEMRTMRCTLKPSLIPKVEPVAESEEKKTKRKQPTTSIAVWDLDAQGWRSFMIDSVQTFAFDVDNFKPYLEQVEADKVAAELAKPKKKW